MNIYQKFQVKFIVPIAFYIIKFLKYLECKSTKYGFCHLNIFTKFLRFWESSSSKELEKIENEIFSCKYLLYYIIIK